MVDSSYAGELAASRDVIPILDGFDEMQPELRSVALETLNDADRPLILLSRTEEYREVVKARGHLRAAAGIILQDLDMADASVAGYLSV